MHLHICTWNSGKYEQICEFLPSLIIPKQADLDIPETQTNLLTEISYDKCLQAYIEMQGPVLVDDSGIYFDAYTDFPGALSKFVYKGIGLGWIAKLFDENVSRKAKFQSVISYMDGTMPEPVQFVWETIWEIDLSIRKKYSEDDLKGLHYDPIFKADGMEVVVSQDLETWKTFNHRVTSVKKFSEWFTTEKIG